MLGDCRRLAFGTEAVTRCDARKEQVHQRPPAYICHNIHYAKSYLTDAYVRFAKQSITNYHIINNI